MREQGSNNLIVTSAHREILRHSSQDPIRKLSITLETDLEYFVPVQNWDITFIESNAKHVSYVGLCFVVCT